MIKDYMCVCLRVVCMSSHEHADVNTCIGEQRPQSPPWFETGPFTDLDLMDYTVPGLLPPPSHSGVTDVATMPSFCMGAGGANSGTRVLAAGSLPTDPSSQTCD